MAHLIEDFAGGRLFGGMCHISPKVHLCSEGRRKRRTKKESSFLALKRGFFLKEHLAEADAGPLAAGREREKPLLRSTG